jgi:2-oxo-4-hydroxy-4-carboxy-5-ureidoimidazoline decarboxylase
VRLFDELNQGPVDEAAERLAACNASRRWIDDVLAQRPYATTEQLLTSAESAARALEWKDVLEALDAHPRIGDRATGDTLEATWSRTEQASVGTADPTVQNALANANTDYERRFGHVFLIRAAGRAPTEMLAELHRRLANDDATEHAEVTEQLAQITRLRLERLLADFPR